MWSSNEIPWMKIDEFLLNVEVVQEPRAFSEQVIRKMFALIPYDQARVYLVNENGKIYDHILFEVKKEWSDAYIHYFSKIENGRYSLLNKIRMDGTSFIPGVEGAVIDWSRKQADEFLNNYIRPQGLSFSAGFRVFDADNLSNCIYCIDRISRSGYTRTEIEIIRKIAPHLNNLFKNVAILGSAYRRPRSPDIQKVLTPRELEIADLLRKGMTPSKIGSRINISLPTVYRHIANIHSKLEVSNRQELLLKLMDGMEADHIN
jgi:DNA-binding CsgD family transcriptional regulator